jgi:cell division protein FtsB
VYILFLDDNDVFSIARQQIKLSKLKAEKQDVEQKYTKTKNVLDQLNSLDALEKFAREEKLFKKDDEDIFVIVREGENQ